MSNMRFEKKDNKNKIKGKGFYIALAICLVAVGAAAWTTYDSVMEFMEPTETEISRQEAVIEQKPQKEEEEAGNTLKGIVERNETNSSEKTSKLEVQQTNTGNDKDKDTLIIFPVGNNIIKEFSDTNPVYSKTLCDWRVHNATDFSAEQGAVVKAMNSGEVKDIYDDPCLGMTIVIEHDEGFTAYYSGLGDTVMVEKGQRVSAGDDIGSINDVPCEINDGMHLHLAVNKDGKWINPMSILEKAKAD